MNLADGLLHTTMHSVMAIKRHVRADEVAAMVAWLGRNLEAATITGAASSIDGGFSA
ncbi:TPA: hypothetical protein QDB06_001635 [Burkholderia vietnamiensis]|uniref:hypothetical protein n=1 Tax=Burkholderia cepacia complex TaxID=87882 RepID=UPI001902F4FD|nr:MULTISPECIES: hypothetical protein [Burkholderia cepacia complex]MBR8215510.1 hypothetical protein [Burkholderia vietnamiensis]HDR9181094.1 hypothetical protein [Burkholderia vietnamiensis]HDV8354151.1 hypothetical protein [Burkholderia vietnamiensis]